MTVNIPEKTVEHWVSMYITYRFSSKAALWWPTQGEDIAIEALPQRPGKAIQLEIKTVRPGAGVTHDVNVDIGQLWEYLQRPCPPYYVIPWPTWSGDLRVAAAAATPVVPVTEIAFARSNDWWFGSWVRVLTPQQVKAVMANELAAHGRRKRGNIRRLVRIDPNGKPPLWGPKGAAGGPVPIPWRDFWSQIASCGSPGWPQIIRLPARVLPSGSSFALSELRAQLVSLGSGKQDERDEEVKPGSHISQVFDDLVTLAPSSNGNYTVVSDEAAQLDVPRRSEEDLLFEDHRQVAFLDARAIMGR